MGQSSREWHPVGSGLEGYPRKPVPLLPLRRWPCCLQPAHGTMKPLLGADHIVGHAAAGEPDGGTTGLPSRRSCTALSPDTSRSLAAQQ